MSPRVDNEQRFVPDRVFSKLLDIIETIRDVSTIRNAKQRRVWMRDLVTMTAVEKPYMSDAEAFADRAPTRDIERAIRGGAWKRFSGETWWEVDRGELLQVFAIIRGVGVAIREKGLDYDLAEHRESIERVYDILQCASSW